MHYTELGYDEYEDFINGPEWKELHDFFYKYCGPYLCGICGKNRNLNLHKRSYEHITMKTLRRKYLFRFLIVRYLKKYMVWLCKVHNGEIHFYDNGSRVPLSYQALLKREIQVRRKHKSIWRRFITSKPEDWLNTIGGLFSEYKT